VIFNARLRMAFENDKLSEDVLLEIFDAYRQLYRETLWDSSDGWLKLAHVCLSWRCIVLSSSSRLHVHLLFTPRRCSTVTMLKHLPPPIVVYHRGASWTKKEENSAIAVIRHRSRVRGIVFHAHTAKLLGALSHPFPELENLEICPYDHDGELALPATFSAPRLRRLTLKEVVPRSLSPLLSSATGLVELSLTMDISPPVSLLANLQRMSCLRRLELNLSYQEYFDDDLPLAGDVVPVTLSKLTHIIFRGFRIYLQALVVGLAAPSLQRLAVE
jgi:hypothetical protein